MQLKSLLPNTRLNQKFTPLKCLRTSKFVNSSKHTLFWRVFILSSRLIIVLRTKIYVFSFPNNSNKSVSFDTCDNPRGLCELSSNDDNLILCFPSVKSGFIQIAEINKPVESISKCPKIFQAHKHDIAAMAIDTNASLIATASAQGTLIRIFDIKTTSDVKQLIELRRGMEPASLYW